MDSTSSPPAVVGFLDHDYRYRSIATQIPYNLRLAMIRPARDGTQDCTGRGNESISVPQRQVQPLHNQYKCQMTWHNKANYLALFVNTPKRLEDIVERQE